MFEIKIIHSLPHYAPTLEKILTWQRSRVYKCCKNKDMCIIYDNVLEKIRTRKEKLEIFGGEIEITKNALKRYVEKTKDDDTELQILIDRLNLTRKQFCKKYGRIDFIPNKN